MAALSRCFAVEDADPSRAILPLVLLRRGERPIRAPLPGDVFIGLGFGSDRGADRKDNPPGV